MKTPTFKIKLPEYSTTRKPDFAAIGKKIDKIIKKNFLGKKIAIRCISSKEHRGKTVGDLIKIIKNFGTDRYSRRRKGDRYNNLENKIIDFFALDFKVSEKSRIMEKFFEPFYEYPLQEGKKPIRIDLATIYDRAQLKMVRHTYDGKREKRDGFVFKNQDEKNNALKGFIIIS